MALLHSLPLVLLHFCVEHAVKPQRETESQLARGQHAAVEAIAVEFVQLLHQADVRVESQVEHEHRLDALHKGFLDGEVGSVVDAAHSHVVSQMAETEPREQADQALPEPANAGLVPDTLVGNQNNVQGGIFESDLHVLVCAVARDDSRNAPDDVDRQCFAVCGLEGVLQEFHGPLGAFGIVVFHVDAAADVVQKCPHRDNHALGPLVELAGRDLLGEVDEPKRELQDLVCVRDVVLRLVAAVCVALLVARQYSAVPQGRLH